MKYFDERYRLGTENVISLLFVALSLSLFNLFYDRHFFHVSFCLCVCYIADGTR